jgi:hypothetical protein
MLSDETKVHVSAFAPSASANFIASHLRAAAKIEAAIDVVAT